MTVFKGLGGEGDPQEGEMYTDEDIAKIAELAGATPRSVERALLRLPVRGKAGKRVAEAIERYRSLKNAE